MCLLVDATLHPNRTVDIAQRVAGEALGGVTIWIQVPLPGDDVELLKKQTATRTRRRTPTRKRRRR
jgi:hypothetical protein